MKAIFCKNCLIIVLLLSFSHLARAEAWFTGPLLAPGGKTIGLGHFNFEMYNFRTSNLGLYSRNWRVIHEPGLDSDQYNPQFSYGLSDWVDTQWSVPYTINHSEGQTGHHLGDASILLGFQALTQHSGSWIPNLRITLQEIVPTGRFDGLNPTDKGTGATGAGGYQSVLGFNFEDFSELSETHSLRTRLCLSYLHAHETNLNGYTSFGGGAATKGQVRPGDLVAADLAGELTLTQNWVAVMEAYYLNRAASQFKGMIGFDDEGNPANIGHGSLAEISLAPAIEYNFSQHYGIIAGMWFSVDGKNAPKFVSAVIAFNIYW